MRIYAFGFLLASALAPSAFAAPIEQLQPMEFLAGHCWKGTFPNGTATDEHCFEWMVDGHALRDRHVVKAEGKPDYAGETIYYWDSEKKIVSYLYVENLGGFSTGTGLSENNMLVFPAARYIDKGEAMTYRTRWTRGDDNSYEVVNEIQNKDQWVTAFKVKMQLQAGRP
jgi:hypothetical protein